MSLGLVVSGAASGATAGFTVGGPVGAAIGGVLGGIAGLFSGNSGAQEQAQKLLQEAYDEITAVGAPPDLSKEIILKKFQSAGLLTPEVEHAVDVGVSQAANLQENQDNIKAQKTALSLLGQRAGGGLNATDRAAFNQMRAEAQRDQEAKRQQIIQNMQARGQGGSGAELAQALLGSQSGAEDEAAAGDRIAAAAASNALNAASQYGSLAGNIRSQDYTAAENKAKAADELNRFNVQAQMDRQQRNIASQNQAQQFNLANAQDISNANVKQANQELQRQAQAKQDLWNNQLRLAQAKAGAAGNQANALMGQAAADNQAFNTAMGGIGQAAGAIGNYTNTQSLLDRIYPANKTSSNSSDSYLDPNYISNNFKLPKK